MKVFTVDNGIVTHGARVENITLSGAGVTIPCIVVGEEGRGRERGILPVSNPPTIPCPNRGDSYVPWGIGDREPVSAEIKTCQCGVKYEPRQAGKKWECFHPNEGYVFSPLLFAEVGETRSGKFKLMTATEAGPIETVIVVFRTGIGFRGGNSHTGDRTGWRCERCTTQGAGDRPNSCPECGEGTELVFGDFPGKVLVGGTIAQGDAGHMGSGQQLVAVLPLNVVFRTGYRGRLYGGPNANYYVAGEEKLISATWDERMVADLF
jgi:hypothetical protein